MEYGIWSEEAGGFLTAQIYSPEQGAQEIAEMVEADAELAGDLTVVEICPDHEGERRDACEECPTDGDGYGDRSWCGNACGEATDSYAATCPKADRCTGVEDDEGTVAACEECDCCKACGTPIPS